MDINEDLLRKETPTEKQEEIEMLQEFERRRKFKAAYDTVNKVKEENDLDENYENKGKKNQEAQDDSPEEILKADPEKDEIYDSK